MSPLLVTGFEPFGGEARNPSQEIALALDGRTIEGHPVIAAVLPCVFGSSLDTLRHLLRRHRPALVVCLGQAAGRREITPERVAVNLDDARIPDNAGAQPLDTPVVARAPVAYWSTLPVKAIVAALRGRGIPAAVSHTAGTFVCNHVFYGLMHALRRSRTTRGGFIHVPLVPEQALDNQPSLPLEQMIEGIALALQTVVRQPTDLQAVGGDLH